MTTAVIALNRVQRNIRTIRARVASIDLPEINWRGVCFIVFFVALALLILYVWQINDLTHGSYLINSYQKQISDLSRENKNFQVSFAESSFLGQALEKIEALNFQKTTSVKYIQILDSAAQAVPKNKNI